MILHAPQRFGPLEAPRRRKIWWRHGRNGKLHVRNLALQLEVVVQGTQVGTGSRYLVFARFTITVGLDSSVAVSRLRGRFTQIMMQ